MSQQVVNSPQNAPRLQGMKNNVINGDLTKSVPSAQPPSPQHVQTLAIAQPAASAQPPNDGNGRVPLISSATMRNAAGQLVTAKVCQTCGTTFESKRPHGRYCSVNCRVAAYRKRKAEK